MVHRHTHTHKIHRFRVILFLFTCSSLFHFGDFVEYLLVSDDSKVFGEDFGNTLLHLYPGVPGFILTYCSRIHSILDDDGFSPRLQSAAVN